jgi:hypothetical protein
MLVYNINPATEAGIYMWTGTGWESLKSNFSEAVRVVGFDLEPSSAVVDILVGEKVSFTAGNFTPPQATYQGVIWTITTGSDKAAITTRSMTGCTVTGLAAGTATLAATGLDEYYRATVTIDVKTCTTVPDAPTGITFSQTAGIKLNEQITAAATPEVTSGGAKPAKYNWTIPDAYFDIIDGHNQRIITLQAKAATSSITDAIKVNAENDCGTSDEYENTTGLTVFDCTDAPDTPGEIEFSVPSVDRGESFTASVPEVTTGTIPTYYTWILPAGLTGSSTSRTIEITASAAGIYDEGSIKVTASNDCGESEEMSSTVAMEVIETCTGVVYNGQCYVRSAAGGTCPAGSTAVAYNVVPASQWYAKYGGTCFDLNTYVERVCSDYCNGNTYEGSYYVLNYMQATATQYVTRSWSAGYAYHCNDGSIGNSTVCSSGSQPTYHRSCRVN